MSRSVTSLAAIKRFVVEVLGCGCPDEVFATIALERERPPIAQVPVTCALNVGGRLLIYVVDAQQLQRPRAQLAALVRAGLAEREAQRLNRFRLVVVAADPAASERALRPMFDRLDLVDERTHLHAVTPEQAAPLTAA